MRPSILRRRLASLLPPRLSVKLAAALGTLVLVMTGVTSFVSYHYFAHILTQENLKKDAQVLRQNAQQLESSVQELMIITRNLLADPQLQQFCHTEDPDYFQREEAAELLTRYLSVQDLLHSALILHEDQVLWNLYPLDQTFDALKTSPDEIRPAGFTEAFQVHSGVDSLWLAAYHTPISDLAHPQQKIGELWILLDLRQLESRIAAWNLPQQEMTLMQGQTVLIPSPSGINEQRLDAVNTLSSAAVQPVQSGYYLTSPVEGTPYTLLSYRPHAALRGRASFLIVFFILFSLLIFLLFLLILSRIVKQFTAPLTTLTDGLNQFASGDLTTQIDIHSHDELEVLGDTFNTMVVRIHQLLDQAVEDEKIRKKLKFDMMISKIHPHFIYNTLNSVIVMARRGGNQEVVDMVRALILILQDGMAVHEDLLMDTIARERSVIEAYVTIQNYRYKQKFSVVYDIEPGLEEQLIAKNILQPLVENAIFHGIIPKDGPGQLTLSIHRRQDQLHVEVRDDGVGLRPELAALIEQGAEALSAHRQAEKNSVHSIALVNVCERLEFLYGHPVHLKVQSELGKGTAFLFDLPLVPKGGSTS